MKNCFQPKVRVVASDVPKHSKPWGEIVRYDHEGFYVVNRYACGERPKGLMIVHEDDMQPWEQILTQRAMDWNGRR